MGMIFKRKEKRKDGSKVEGKVWWIKYYRNGKAYRESTRSTKEADAKRLLRKREGEISEGKIPGIYYDKIHFEELAEDFLVDYRVNGKKSYVRAEGIVRLHLQPFFVGNKATNISTSIIKRYIGKR